MSAHLAEGQLADRGRGTGHAGGLRCAQDDIELGSRLAEAAVRRVDAARDWPL